MDDSVINESIVTMKLDAIELSERRPQRSSSANAIKALEQKLRKFFNEADGHGSLHRKPPPNMITPQYFKVVNTISCYPIKRMDWIALVNSANFKRKFTIVDDSTKTQRPNAIVCGKDNDKPHPSSPSKSK
ncbi:hypothetical protein TSAR_004824 [Trichomalopsis sarcophagae]|uniref:Uncharacterized protein n=1 Tax=Trichomalopsis sarcophagae TaxID=543379 RepID=A0A232FDA7_9HYME|nr:hypothetical protein TSAR_004824 [Trichomalopsis sarcophagae]